MTFLLRLLVISIMVQSVTACSSFYQIEGQQTKLEQDALIDESLIKVGDTIQLTTASGEVYEFEVTSIDKENKVFIGEEHRIAIDDIVELKKEGFSVIKTGSLIYVIYTIALILAAPALILSGG